MTDVHQLVFGYDDGHRLLVASTKLLADTQALLLSTTDADPGDDFTHIVTGIPLPAERMYALCFTWRAPELPRPGSVWAHVLLLSAAHLRDPNSPYGYASYARRPALDNLATYGRPLAALPQETPFVEQRSLWRVAELVLRHSSGTIRDPDLHDAADAFGFLWGLQWPALRSRFRFRTRHVARATGGRQTYLVARKVEGVQTSLPVNAGYGLDTPTAHEVPWHLIEHELGIRAFMFEFGPENPSTSRTFAALHDIYWACQDRDALRCRLFIESSFPDVRQAMNLKVALFGLKAHVFTVDSVVQALLGASFASMDLQSLHFDRQFSNYISAHGVIPAVECLASPAPPDMAEVVARSLRAEADLNDLVWILEHRPDIFGLILDGDVPALQSVTSWGSLSSDQAAALVRALPLTSPLVSAATHSHHTAALIATRGWTSVLELCLAEGDEQLGSLLLDAARPTSSDVLSWNPALLIFAVACHPPLLKIDGVAARLEIALEWDRERPDSTWLRAAAMLVAAGGVVADHSLVTSFGPLHRALTEDRLPQQAWLALDPILPASKDTSYRFRDYLLNVAAYRDWSAQELVSALRDAGPFARERFWPKRGAGDRVAKQLRAILAGLGWAP